MSVLNRIAAAQGRRDEAPNQELARELAEREDREGIYELVANLHHADPNVRSDCLKTLYPRRQRIQDALAEGSVITVDNGAKVLAAVAAASDAYRTELLPYLLHHLQTCRPKDVPQHAEAIVPAVDAAHADAFVAILERRQPNMSASQATRVKRVLAQARQAAKQTG